MGSPPTPLSDIYALGCTAYWLLTGRLVFETPSLVDLLRAHDDQTPVAPSRVADVLIPAELDRLVLRCVEKNPGNRPQTAMELRELFDAVPLETPWTTERAKEWRKKHITTN